MDTGQHQAIEKTPPQGFFIRERDCDIFLAHDIDDPVKGKERIPLYEAVGSLCARMGHEVFLPYRSVGFQGNADEMPGQEAHTLINEIMIPQVQLVLCYLGINSKSIETMNERAKKLQKDIIYFYEEGTHLETVAEREAKRTAFPRTKKQQKDIIHFYEKEMPLETVAGVEAKVQRLPRADSGILQVPRVYFHRNIDTLALYRYPKIRGLVEFTSINDCITKLRETLHMYFIR